MVLGFCDRLRSLPVSEPPTQGLVVTHNCRDPIRLARMVNKMERLSDATKAVTDPIRLVRMVKEIDPLPRSAHLADESPSPT